MGGLSVRRDPGRDLNIEIATWSSFRCRNGHLFGPWYWSRSVFWKSGWSWGKVTLDGSWCTTPECLCRADLWIHVVRANGRQKPLRNHINSCNKSFSSYRRPSENDSSLPLFFPTDERDCTKDFYSVNIKIYKMSASPQQQTSEWKWKWRNDRRSEPNLCNCVKKPEKNQDFNGVWTRDLAIPVRCSTNWAMKPLTLRSLRRSFLHFHSFISFPQFIYYLFHISLTNQWVCCRPGSVQLNL